MSLTGSGGSAQSERPSARDGLDVPAVAVGLAGVPGVDLLALYAGRGLGAAVGLEDLAVQDHLGHALGHRPLQRLWQGRGLL